VRRVMLLVSTAPNWTCFSIEQGCNIERHHTTYDSPETGVRRAALFVLQPCLSGCRAASSMTFSGKSTFVVPRCRGVYMPPQHGVERKQWIPPCCCFKATRRRCVSSSPMIASPQSRACVLSSCRSAATYVHTSEHGYT
jgi:hypothetical protein